MVRQALYRRDSLRELAEIDPRALAASPDSRHRLRCRRTRQIAGAVALLVRAMGSFAASRPSVARTGTIGACRACTVSMISAAPIRTERAVLPAARRLTTGHVQG